MDRYKASLKDQVDFLINDCLAFDKGDRRYAIPMAAKLRVILNTTRDKKGKIKDKSILRHLNSTHINFYNTIGQMIDGKNLLADYPLVYITAHSDINKSGFSPILDSGMVPGSLRYRSFENWWRKDLIYSDNAVNNGEKISIEFTRWLLILSVANKDGGTHLDAELPHDYYKLSRSSHITTFINDQQKEHSDLHLVMVRQIAHETLLTFYRHFNYIDIREYYENMRKTIGSEVLMNTEKLGSIRK